MNGKILDQCFVQIRFMVACRSVIVVFNCFSISNHFAEGIIEVPDFLQKNHVVDRRSRCVGELNI